MIKYAFSLVMLLFISNLALAGQENQFVIDSSVSSHEPNHIVYITAKDAPIEVTFKVNKMRQMHNAGLQSDTLTVNCHGQISLIKSGQSGTCSLAQGQEGNFHIADADFVNGTDGSVTNTLHLQPVSK